jgi:hypothetical protein
VCNLAIGDLTNKAKQPDAHAPVIKTPAWTALGTILLENSTDGALLSVLVVSWLLINALTVVRSLEIRALLLNDEGMAALVASSSSLRHIQSLVLVGIQLSVLVSIKTLLRTSSFFLKQMSFFSGIAVALWDAKWGQYGTAELCCSAPLVWKRKWLHDEQSDASFAMLIVAMRQTLHTLDLRHNGFRVNKRSFCLDDVSLSFPHLC